jgi:SF-assemblin/beta giardin
MAEDSSRLNVSHDSAMSGEDSANTTGATEQQLSLLHESFQWEEEILKHATARRHRHETSLSKLAVQLGRLQAAMGRESKRRVSAVAELERSVQGRLNDLEEQFAARLDEQHHETLQALSGLEHGVSELEARWERQLGDVASAFETTVHDLSSQLDEIKAAVEEERSAADERHASQATQIESLQREYDGVWKKERQERLGSLHDLTDRIEGQEDVAHMHLKELQDQIGEQLQLLAEELRQEAHERQAGDEEIVAGLNRYMSQIQKSLQYAVL